MTALLIHGNQTTLRQSMTRAIAEVSVEFQQCGCSKLLAPISLDPGGATMLATFTSYPSIPRYRSHSDFAGDPGTILILLPLSLPTLQVDFSEGSEQLKFVSEDLATVDRCQFPWIILGGHRPMYIDSTYGGNPSSDIVSFVGE